jgi:hypothetical protein
LGTKGVERGALFREMEREGRGAGQLTRGRRDERSGWRSPEHGRRRWTPVSREQRVVARKTERSQREIEKKVSSLASGWRRFFLKRDMGAPDSLQCMSGAHRTAHNSCPVNHRIAHKKMDFERAAAGAPDIAQCSVQCTPDCPVSPDRGKIWIF